MRRAAALLGLLAALAPVWVFAADPLGPPRASLAPGQFSLGVEYSYAQLELRKRRPDYEDQVITPLGIDNMHTTYLSLSVGTMEWLECFVRIGGVTMAGDEQEKASSTRVMEWDYDYDTELIFGGGLRVTFATLGKVTLGAVASYSYANFDGAYQMDGTKITTHQLKYRDWGTVDAQMQQWCIGVGAVWQLRENLALYGGGLFQRVLLHQTIQMNDSSITEVDDTPFSSSYRNDGAASQFGGYGGIEWTITQHVTLRAEGSLTEDSLGGSLMLGMDF